MTTFTMSSCNQQPTNQAVAAQDEGLTIAQVEHGVGELRDALLTPNEAALNSLTAETMTYGHSTGLIEDRETFIHSLVTGKFVFTQLEFSEQTIDITGNTAIVRHILFGHTADEGKEPGTVRLKVLTVWQKSGEKLCLLARQAVRL